MEKIISTKGIPGWVYQKRDMDAGQAKQALRDACIILPNTQKLDKSYVSTVFNKYFFEYLQQINWNVFGKPLGTGMT